MLEYSPAYANSTATNEFFYLDTTRSAEERSAQATYNKGFALRKALLGTSTTVTTEIIVFGPIYQKTISEMDLFEGRDLQI